MNNFLKNYLLIVVSGLFFMTGTAFAEVKTEETFPLYESIKPNFNFWKKVYSEYTTSQVIFHDRRDLRIIYGIIAIKDNNEPGARSHNKKILNDKKKYYIKLLKKLSGGHEQFTSEEKLIHSLFTENNLTDLLRDSHNNIRTQLGQKDRFIAGLIRSGAYFKEMKEILKSYGVPEDLAYLPHVESSFDYQAYSKFGAAGIWQFTRDTGRRYLKIDYTLDERRDPILATHAAARFLKENYDILKSWPIAITAYNHGTQGMMKAIKLNKDYENIYNKYEGRTFGFASRNFYSEFLAAREVAKNHRDYFGELKLDKPVKRITVEAPGYVAVDDLVKHFNLSVDVIKELNPALREPVYSNQKYIPKNYSIYIPEEIFSYPGTASPQIPLEILKSSQKPSLFYRVRSGDTAGKIAKEQNVELKDLILANQLNSRATIYAGQNLRIPVPGEKIILASARIEESPATKVNPDEPPLKEPQNIRTEQETPANIKTVDIRALSLSGPDAEEERDLPAITEEPPASSEVDRQINPLIITGDLSVEKITTVNDKLIGIIRVEPEETLGHYADWLQIETQKIRRLNGFSYERDILVGQKIKIPLDNASREIFEEKRYEYHKELEEDFFAAYRIEKTEKYIIKSGDNPWVLCMEKFEIPFWLLKKYNPEIDFNRLIRSGKLTVPVVVKIRDEGIVNIDQ